MSLTGRPALLLLAALAGCRSGGPVVARVLPDPVPVCAADGRAYYLVELQSRAHEPLLVAGHRLPPEGLCVLARSLGPGEDRDRLELRRPDGSLAHRLELAVATCAGPQLADLDFPLPDLGGHEVRITAGFHAPNHRRPGRRLALDLVPVLPDGASPLGVEVRAPFACRVLALTEEAPDRPSVEANELWLRDRRGRVWRYAHFARDSIPVRLDQELGAGALLGRLGLSGPTSGPHLHVELVSPSEESTATGSPAKLGP
ncbi:MAG: M23 family metallopeptidase [Planctomycetota bacterium]